MTRGGYRPGAGRPKGTKKVKPAKVSAPVENPKPMKNFNDEPPSQLTSKLPLPCKEGQLPLDYMLTVMRDPEVDAARRDRMAIAAAPFIHARKDTGISKKEQQEEAANVAASGKFSTSQAPKIVRIR